MRRVAALLFISLITSACSGDADASGPPEITYGRDLCIECGMVISEERFAAAYRFDGEALRFDDIGGMLLHGTEGGGLPAAGDDAWVHDWDTRSWLSAETAWYVVAEGLVTPMGYGIVAFADRDAAQAFAAEQSGDLFGWEQLFEFSIEPGRLVHEQDMGNMDQDMEQMGETP